MTNGTAIQGRDARKRQTDYIVRAAQDAGHQVTVDDDHSRMPAAVLRGPHAVGVEVRRARFSREHAQQRTAAALQSGLATSMWFNDQQSLPAWFFHVPSVGMNVLPWDVVPARRAVTVTTGARRIQPYRCGDRDLPCPHAPTTARKPCGSLHPTHRPWQGLTVDDVASLGPEGQLVPLKFHGKDVILVDPDSRLLYQELTSLAPAPPPTLEIETPTCAHVWPSELDADVTCVLDCGLRYADWTN